jgi:hypothetical protein
MPRPEGVKGVKAATEAYQMYLSDIEELIEEIAGRLVDLAPLGPAIGWQHADSLGRVRDKLIAAALDLRHHSEEMP